MTKRLALILSVVLLASCSDRQEVAEQQTQQAPPTPKVPDGPVQLVPIPGPGQQFEIKYKPEVIDSILRLPAGQRAMTPEEAIKLQTGDIRTMPIPPHVLPPKNLKKESETETTASYTFQSQHSPEQGMFGVTKIGNGKDSAWVLTRFVLGPPR